MTNVIELKDPMDRVKVLMGRAAVAALAGHPDAVRLADEALAALEQAGAPRAEAVGLDQALERTCESLTPGVTTHE